MFYDITKNLEFLVSSSKHILVNSKKYTSSLLTDGIKLGIKTKLKVTEKAIKQTKELVSDFESSANGPVVFFTYDGVETVLSGLNKVVKAHADGVSEIPAVMYSKQVMKKFLFEDLPATPVDHVSTPIQPYQRTWNRPGFNKSYNRY